MAGLSALKRKAAAKLILQRVSEAYGEMMLTEGLFQADAHPGCVLAMLPLRRAACRLCGC